MLRWLPQSARSESTLLIHLQPLPTHNPFVELTRHRCPAHRPQAFPHHLPTADRIWSDERFAHGCRFQQRPRNALALGWQDHHIALPHNPTHVGNFSEPVHQPLGLTAIQAVCGTTVGLRSSRPQQLKLRFGERVLRPMGCRDEFLDALVAQPAGRHEEGDRLCRRRRGAG